MALPKYTETRYRIWHYIYLSFCTFVFFTDSERNAIVHIEKTKRKTTKWQ